jgi:putative heme-binding domain-containing protein
LIGPFGGNSDPAVGHALVTALGISSDRLENISEEDLTKLFTGYPENIKTSAKPLMDELRKKNEARLSELQAVDARLTRGDVGQGRQLFFGKAVCATCHAVQGQGGTFAPDLTNIGQIRSRHDILEAILFPSASFAREHETSKVTTNATAYIGIIKEQFPEAIVIATGPGQTVRVQRSDIKSTEPQNYSLMPPGLNKQLSNGQLSDLIAYLTSLPDGMGGHGDEH